MSDRSRTTRCCTGGRAAAVPWLLLMALPWWSACDSDNVQWAFISNPSGSLGVAGGAVLVVRTTSNSRLDLEGAFLRVDGHDDRGEVSVLLPHEGDFGILQRRGEVEIRSPALSLQVGGSARPGRIVAPGATLDLPAAGGPAAVLVRLPDAASVHPGGVGRGTLHIASAGTLLILDSLAGLVVFGEREEPEVIGTSASLTTTTAGNAYALRLLDGRVRLLHAPPAPLPQQRIQRVESRGSVRLLGPTGEVLAELPGGVVELQNGVGGIFLRAHLPQGLPGDPHAMSLWMTTNNRYLLRVEE